MARSWVDAFVVQYNVYELIANVCIQWRSHLTLKNMFLSPISHIGAVHYMNGHQPPRYLQASFLKGNYRSHGRGPRGRRPTLTKDSAF